MAKKKSDTKKAPEGITLDQIRERAQGDLVEIPDWTPGDTIHVRLRAVDFSPYLLQLDQLPNNLQKAAVEVFEGESTEEEAAKKLEAAASEEADGSSSFKSVEKLLPMIESIAKEALAEPTYDEIQEVYPLTLAQKMAIFHHSMQGVGRLEKFRS